MIYLRDPDVTLYHGDVLEVLRELPAESVDCVVTSPPYWGLRDYGTGGWKGGGRVWHPCPTCDGRPGNEDCSQCVGEGGWDAECDHAPRAQVPTSKTATAQGQLRDKPSGVCSKCGATRIDRQLGLEPTPELYVERMVEVFREVRRVLTPHGTVWCNLGDSYGSGTSADRNPTSTQGPDVPASWSNRSQPLRNGLKPKDLVGIPWRVAFALQADGWYLRSDIIWAKPNPMPESVTDRPTKSHEYLFLLSKRPRYYFDAEAVREKAEWARWGDQTVPKYEGTETATGWMENGKKEDLQARAASGRNIRSVWPIATQPYPEAHFATFPEELARRAIAAGCPEQVCRVCGKARERIIERGELVGVDRGGNYKGREVPEGVYVNPGTPGMAYERIPAGFTDCGHADYRPGITLDPFIGSGTVAYVARKLGRHAWGIDLNAEYLALAAKRLSQQSLFAVEASA